MKKLHKKELRRKEFRKLKTELYSFNYYFGKCLDSDYSFIKQKLEQNHPEWYNWSNREPKWFHKQLYKRFNAVCKSITYYNINHHEDYWKLYPKEFRDYYW